MSTHEDRVGRTDIRAPKGIDRAEIGRLWDSFVSAADIAAMMGCDIRTVRTVVARLLDTGQVVRRPAMVGQRAVTAKRREDDAEDARERERIIVADMQAQAALFLAHRHPVDCPSLAPDPRASSWADRKPLTTVAPWAMPGVLRRLDGEARS